MIRTRTDSRALLFDRIRSAPAKFVHVTGVPYAVELASGTPEDPKHCLWVTLEVPPFGRLRTTINTCSDLCTALGVNAQLRMAVLQSTWSEKPATGLVECDGMNYSALEALQPVDFQERDECGLTAFLADRARTAVRAEVWGDLYASDHLGIRQVHCRRASAAVPQDTIGRDGAVKFYYAAENAAELLLFKFYGQP